METINTKNQIIWYDPELLAQVPEGEMVQIFEAEYWQQREAIWLSTSMAGRGQRRARANVSIQAASIFSQAPYHNQILSKRETATQLTSPLAHITLHAGLT